MDGPDPCPTLIYIHLILCLYYCQRCSKFNVTLLSCVVSICCILQHVQVLMESLMATLCLPELLYSVSFLRCIVVPAPDGQSVTFLLAQYNCKICIIVNFVRLLACRIKQ